MFQDLAQTGFHVTSVYMDERVIWRFKSVSRLRANIFSSLLDLEIKGLGPYVKFKVILNVLLTYLFPSVASEIKGLYLWRIKCL